jgi:hypothetical protein
MFSVEYASGSTWVGYNGFPDKDFMLNGQGFGIIQKYMI